MTKVEPVRTEQDYEAALDAVKSFSGNEPVLDTSGGDPFGVVYLLVAEHERKYYPIEPPTSIETIKFRTEQQRLTVEDLGPAIGKSNHAYEILNGIHNLTLLMIRWSHAQLGIPLESLIGMRRRGHSLTHPSTDLPPG